MYVWNKKCKELDYFPISGIKLFQVSSYAIDVMDDCSSNN